MPSMQVLRISEYATMPTQATDRAQCIDLYAAEDAYVQPNGTAIVSLGIKIVLPDGYGLEFRERSGLASKGIIVGGGIIDEDYHGELKAIVRYLRSNVEVIIGGPSHAFKISKGDKIVQAELVKRIPVTIEEVDETDFTAAASDSERGEKGFGSTGL